MTPKEQKTAMLVMVSLIVLLVMSISYIWYAEMNKPIFGKHAELYEEIKALEGELSQSRSIIDSLAHLQTIVPAFELRHQPADSLLCKTCPNVENINGVYYELLGTFHSAEEARFLGIQLIRNGMHAIKIFHRNGLQAVELSLNDSIQIAN